MFTISFDLDGETFEFVNIYYFNVFDKELSFETYDADGKNHNNVYSLREIYNVSIRGN